jgi:hypothetical protein
MIAGALAADHRTVVVGDHTYGKGCAQEYLDNDAHAGVLRLTTLPFSLPDGSPVQKTGIFPNVRFSLPCTNERESPMTRALGPRWNGAGINPFSMAAVCCGDVRVDSFRERERGGRCRLALDDTAEGGTYRGFAYGSGQAPARAHSAPCGDFA